MIRSQEIRFNSGWNNNQHLICLQAVRKWRPLPPAAPGRSFPAYDKVFFLAQFVAPAQFHLDLIFATPSIHLL